MPIVYSKHPIGFNQSIDGSTAANLYAGITAVLTSAGWTGTAITGGIEYTIQSPQELEDLSHLRAKVRVWVESVAWADGTANTVAVQFAGYEPTSGSGMIHWLRHGGTWMCWANACSLAIARLGVSRAYPTDTGYGGSAVIGGIPSVQETFTGCGMEGRDVPVLTDLWFSAGDIRHDLFAPAYRENWRNSVISDINASSSSVNGTVLTPTIAAGIPYANYGVPSILVFVPGQQRPIYTVARTRWWNASGTVANPVYYPPMIGWGTPADVYPRVRGVFFDSLVSSVGQNIDASLSLHNDDDGKDLDFFNFTFDKDTPRNGHDASLPNATGGLYNYYGSLLLMTGSIGAGAEGNVAY